MTKGQSLKPGKAYVYTGKQNVLQAENEDWVETDYIPSGEEILVAGMSINNKMCMIFLCDDYKYRAQRINGSSNQMGQCNG